MKKIVTDKQESLAPWKLYWATTVESFLAFFLGTFSIAMFISHHGENWLWEAILLGVLYLFSLGVIFKRIIDKFSLAAFMLIVPIAPLLALITVVALIPLLQVL